MAPHPIAVHHSESVDYFCRTREVISGSCFSLFADAEQFLDERPDHCTQAQHDQDNRLTALGDHSAKFPEQTRFSGNSNCTATDKSCKAKLSHPVARLPFGIFVSISNVNPERIFFTSGTAVL